MFVCLPVLGYLETNLHALRTKLLFFPGKFLKQLTIFGKTKKELESARLKVLKSDHEESKSQRDCYAVSII